MDHLLGGGDLPVLTDPERAEVGTIYVQESRFMERLLGAAHVARNVGRHLETVLADRGGGFAPLIYCWRGGMRSNAMATILSHVGWRTTVLSGGYRTYRRAVTGRLYDGTLDLRFVLLTGTPGRARPRCWEAGRAGTADPGPGRAWRRHRGSLFGALAGQAQPSQKLFESRLWRRWTGWTLAGRGGRGRVGKIGDRMIPPALWTRFGRGAADRALRRAADRARYLVAPMRLTADRAALETAFGGCRCIPAASAWPAGGAGDAGAFAELAAGAAWRCTTIPPTTAAPQGTRGRCWAIALVPDDAASQARRRSRSGGRA
jgi:tRNA 2-selenouridine synthase